MPATQVAPLSMSQDAYLLREFLSHFRGNAKPPLVGWIGFEFDTAPDLPRLQSALAAVVQRHDVLRAEFTDVFTLEASNVDTIFARLKDLDARSSLFSARICGGVPVHISTVPIERIEGDPNSRALDVEEIRAEINRPFKYDRPPLWRATLFQSPEGRCVLGFTIHHLIADALSMEVLRRELAHFYRGLATTDYDSIQLPPPRAQYANFALWQREQVDSSWQDGVSYWRRQWRDFVPDLLTFADIPGAAGPSRAVVNIAFGAYRVDAALAADLRAFCRRNRLTPYMAWLAAWTLLCRVYVGRDRIAFFTHHASRTRLEWMDLIGWFANASLWGFEAPAAADGATVLDAVRGAVLRAIAHQDVPMSTVWRQLLRERILAPDFAVHEWIVFDFVNVNTQTEAEPWSRVWARIDGRQSKPEFAIVVEDNGDGFTLVCRYPTMCFTPAVARVLHDLHAVMGRLVSSPQEAIGRYADLLDIASRPNTPPRQ